MSQSRDSRTDASTSKGSVPEMTLIETLRVLEVARGMQRDRSVAEQALARNELREGLKKRLLDAAAVTGDRVTEADIEAAIEQYFAQLYVYHDPPLSFRVLLAHAWVRRFRITLIAGLFFAGILVWQFLF